MSKRALILGAGQDASYLAELLLEKGYEVHLLHRRSSADNLWRIRHLLDRLTLHKGDLADPLSVGRAIVASCAREVYHLADQDHIDHSYAAPDVSMNITAGSVVRLLEHFRTYGAEPHTTPRIFVPLSITMFGSTPPPQDENTPLAPASPYAVAKAAAWLACQHYRREHGLWVACGIMANHDSPRRQGDYLLHKLAKRAVLLAAGKAEEFPLGDPNLRIDVGHAPDFVNAAWRVLQLDAPDDFVLGTGVSWTVRELAETALRAAGVEKDGEWGYSSYFVADADFHRPGKAPAYLADNRKAVRAGVWPDRHSEESGPARVVRDLVAHYQAKLAKEGTV